MYVLAHYRPQDEAHIVVRSYNDESEVLDEWVSQIEAGLIPHTKDTDAIIEKFRNLTRHIQATPTNSKFSIDSTVGVDVVRTECVRDDKAYLTMTTQIFKHDESEPDGLRVVRIIKVKPSQLEG